MVSIDRVYKTVLTLANSDIRGNIKPSEFRDLINLSVNEIYEDYLYEVNRLVNRQNRGLMNTGLEKIPDRIREKIQHFSKDAALTFTTPVFNLPADLRYIDSIWYNENTELEPCKNATEFKTIANFIHTTPSADYPIYLQQGTNIKVLPITINANVTITYLRNPLIAKWTYIVVSGAEIFNPSAGDFQDIDLHPSEEATVILKTLAKVGINLKENDIQAAMANQDAASYNKENAS